MSRNIPSVKRWLVRYYTGQTMIYIGAVSAPTRLLARLVARDCMLQNTKWLEAWRVATRVTFTPARRQRAI